MAMDALLHCIYVHHETSSGILKLKCYRNSKIEFILDGRFYIYNTVTVLVYFWVILLRENLCTFIHAQHSCNNSINIQIDLIYICLPCPDWGKSIFTGSQYKSISRANKHTVCRGSSWTLVLMIPGNSRGSPRLSYRGLAGPSQWSYLPVVSLVSRIISL